MRVLLAEDDPIFRLDLAQMLSEMGASEVCQCQNGAQALTMLKEKNWDLVVLDVAMPGIDGLRVAGEVSRLRLAPVILVTAYSDEQTIKRAMESGVMAYLVKPLQEDRLKAAIQLAQARFAELKKVQLDVHQLREQLADREAIQQAKAKLQQEKGMSEEEAYSFIRRQSMVHQQKMGQVARQILEGDLYF
ncbi:ANTAR domain-containing response regulator [Desulfofundulus sp.]|uniref:ANTAR domain-containing response regulator n=1 Tax=Desulfofundulus sp. TaxID=2282750 RepID=UPI003C71CE38